MAPGATEHRNPGIDAVLREPAIRRGFTKMLKAVDNDADALADYLREHLAAALSVLPTAPGPTTEFQTLLDSTHGRLEARRGTHSAKEFRLTLKDVEPGKTHEKLKDLVEEMNAKFRDMKNYPKCGFEVVLSGNHDVPNYNEAGDIVFTCSSLITDSTNRHWTERTIHQGEERLSQTELLAHYELSEVSNDIARVIAGLFRLAIGFPTKQGDIGTRRDQGDIFEGQIVRTKQGRLSGSVASCQRGVLVSGWRGKEARNNVGLFGGHPPKLQRRMG